MTDTYVPACLPQSDGSPAGITGPCFHIGTKDVPHYLRKYYWWAYIHPRAVQFFERQWLVGAILWGNYALLRDAALAELGAAHGATLQIACAYGDLTTRLAQKCTAENGTLDVVDVLPIQLQNLRKKLPETCRARLLAMNSADLQLPDRSYDQVLVFFLLHEQPAEVRRRTLQEAFRVMKAEGKIVIVDYAQPQWWHPLRYTWRLVLAALEPFALDLWREDIAAWIPAGYSGHVRSQSFFGGLYKMTIVTRGQNS
jgi:ubiquinone/menaquinone biosynthesis C-methylase UbiE